jgi:hypothetical protein
MKDIFDGAKRLLSESITLIDDSIKDEIVIVGGWGVYLRHKEVHPGTKDVDILLPISYTKDSVTQVLTKFLNNGFFISAKHDFQLCKAYEIGSHTYIYNVDLLHPTQGKVNKVDFIQIMDLDVTVDGIRVKPIISINIEFGDVISSEKLFQYTEFNGQKFKVLDGAGIVISKMNSCQNKKRPRDIYDIYLSLMEPGILEKLDHLRGINPTIKENFATFLSKIQSEWETYEEHLKEFKVNSPDGKKVLLSLK